MRECKCALALILVTVSVFLLCGCNNSAPDPYNEGLSTVIKQTTWLDSAGNTHAADFYTAVEYGQVILKRHLYLIFQKILF